MSCYDSPLLLAAYGRAVEQGHQRQEHHKCNNPEDRRQNKETARLDGLQGGTCDGWQVEARDHDQDGQEEARSEVHYIENRRLPWPAEKLKRHVRDEDRLATQHLQRWCVWKEDHWQCQQRSLEGSRFGQAVHVAHWVSHGKVEKA